MTKGSTGWTGELMWAAHLGPFGNVHKPPTIQIVYPLFDMEFINKACINFKFLASDSKSTILLILFGRVNN